jgi:hypothetical protein
MTFNLYFSCTCSIVAESPIASQQPPLAGTIQQPSTGQPNAITGTEGGGAKLESGSGSSLKSGQSAVDDNNKTANDGSQELQGGSASAVPSSSGGGEESTASIFLQTAAYLLDVHALKVHCTQMLFLCSKLKSLIVCL